MNGFRLHLTPLEGRELASASAAVPIDFDFAGGSYAAHRRGAPTPAPVANALRDALQAARVANDVPAVAGGVVLDGRVAALGATGVRERGSATPVSLTDAFDLGSNGKAMTATLAGVLVDRRAIRWDTTLGQSFPELRGRIDPAYANVTLEQLLNHRGGFRDENVDPALFERVAAYRGSGRDGRLTFLRDILNTTPGAAGEFSYSNAGYALAAAMMERATGRSYEGLMRRDLFLPLGMGTAGFGAVGAADSRLRTPRGHDETGAPVGTGPDATIPAVLFPAGGMSMSMNDWSKFLRVHLGQRVNGVKLLTDATLAKLHTADPRPAFGPDDTYGFGWVHVQTPAGPALWHNGSNGFWYSEAIVIPSKNAAIFVVTNQGGDRGVASTGGVLAAVGAKLAG